jgi:vacuolar protein sorting-associated protein VTA1
MKQDIGSDDAIEVETASAAFVENFALKVFQSADNEDRRGAVTRSVYLFKVPAYHLILFTRTTAKKFLAASNFLEVLKTFPKAEVSESVRALSCIRLQCI